MLFAQIADPRRRRLRGVRLLFATWHNITMTEYLCRAYLNWATEKYKCQITGQKTQNCHARAPGLVPGSLGGNTQGVRRCSSGRNIEWATVWSRSESRSRIHHPCMVDAGGHRVRTQRKCELLRDTTRMRYDRAVIAMRTHSGKDVFHSWRLRVAAHVLGRTHL